MVIVFLLCVRHSLRLWRWRNEEFSILLPHWNQPTNTFTCATQDQRSYSVLIPRPPCPAQTPASYPAPACPVLSISVEKPEHASPYAGSLVCYSVHAHHYTFPCPPCYLSIPANALLLQLVMSICAQGLWHHHCSMRSRVPSPNTYLLSSPLNVINSCLSVCHLSS